MLNGLVQLNCELTSRCSKKTLCSMCSHQDREKNPLMQYGDMDFDLLKSIRAQLELTRPIIEWHRDGDPLDYWALGDALDLFRGFISCVVTNGERLAEKADEIIEQCTSVCISVLWADPDLEIQHESVVKFLERKGARLPHVILKYVGRAPYHNPYASLGLLSTTRKLHVPDGNFKYEHNYCPPIPESGVCLDFLGRPAIDWQGKMFQCVKFDPLSLGYLGNLNMQSLEAIWNSPHRAAMLKHHAEGRRDLANSLCGSCLYYGLPSNG